jgi:hypothetical protein
LIPKKEEEEEKQKEKEKRIKKGRTKYQLVGKPN